MIAIKDSSVLIHLAKTALLEAACSLFGSVLIPNRVYEETVSEGLKGGHADALIIDKAVKEKKIKVMRVTNRGLLKRVAQFNIQGGEAEAIALYWQERADLLASDDDNVRKKKVALGLNLIGTPSIILSLAKNKIVKKEKALEAVSKLREIGWFSSSVLDALLMEVEG